MTTIARRRFPFSSTSAVLVLSLLTAVACGDVDGSGDGDGGGGGETMAGGAESAGGQSGSGSARSGGQNSGGEGASGGTASGGANSGSGAMSAIGGSGDMGGAGAENAGGASATGGSSGGGSGGDGAGGGPFAGCDCDAPSVFVCGADGVTYDAGCGDECVPEVIQCRNECPCATCGCTPRLSGICSEGELLWECLDNNFDYQGFLDEGCIDVPTGLVRYCCPSQADSEAWCAP